MRILLGMALVCFASAFEVPVAAPMSTVSAHLLVVAAGGGAVRVLSSTPALALSPDRARALVTVRTADGGDALAVRELASGAEQIVFVAPPEHLPSAVLEVDVDRRDIGGGTKNWEWIKKGVPLRVEIGPRDLESNSVAVSRRDQPVKTKETMSSQEIVSRAPEILDSIQNNLFERAKKFRDEQTRVIESKEDFYDFFTPKNSGKPEIHGGFALAHWNGSREIEEQIKNDLKVTIRVIPFGESETGRCIFTGEPSPRRVIWAKSY